MFGAHGSLLDLPLSQSLSTTSSGRLHMEGALLMKLCVRFLLLISCHRFSANNRFVQAARQATKHHADSTRDVSPQERRHFPVPHIHVWASWITFLEAQLTEQMDAKAMDPHALQIAKIAHQQVQGYKSAHTQAKIPWSQLITDARYARVPHMYDREVCRIDVNLKENSLSAAMWKFVLQAMFLDKAYELFLGITPKGENVRQIQEWHYKNT